MNSFEPFRVVGSVCGEVPVSVTMLHGTPLLMVATGRTFQLFKGKELAMLRGGPTYADPVSSVAQSGKYRFVAEGPRIHALVHHKALWECEHEPMTKPLVRQLLAQDDLLFVLGEDKRIVVREGRTGRVLQDILVERSESVRCMALLTGYNNKLVAATDEGALHIYNYKTGRCLWHRPGASATATSSSTAAVAPILSLVCSSYKDIIAYGTAHGRVVVMNVAADEVIATFEHDQGAVTALAFRADKDGLLVAGTSLGDVVVWDLENRCADGMLTRSKQVRSEREALEKPHMDAVHSLITFPPSSSGSASPPPQQQQELAAMLVTGAADNALMQFRFDTVDGLGRLVRERRGHMGACTCAAFYNSDLVATAGSDRAVRVTHVFSDRASWELSQGKLGKKGREQLKGREALKLPPAVAMASSTTRNYQWASLVSLHLASAQVCGWRMDSRALDFKLSGIHTSAHTARCVTVSDCGNFAVVGYSSGNASIMNVQNRSVRQLFDPALSGVDRAHDGSVECVHVACGNTVVVTAGLDGVVKMWALFDGTVSGSGADRGSGALLASIVTGQPIGASCLHPDASLLLTAQHHTIRGYHCSPGLGLSRAELMTPVREFVGHTAPVTAMAISPDTYRYVASTSADGALRLWDLAAAACVGHYRFPAPVTSMSFHPDALFLVTTHAGERGAFLWVNNLRYGYVPEVVPSSAATAAPWMHFPTAHGAVEAGAGDADDGATGEAAVAADADADADGEAELFDESTDVALGQRARQRAQWAALDEIETAGLQLSGLPRSVWLNLTALDQIKEKNQPLLPPKKKDVPFFLPTTQELRPTFILVASDRHAAGAESGDGAPDRLARADLSALSPVQEMLVHSRHDELMAYLLSANPSNGSSSGSASTTTTTAHAEAVCTSAQAIDLELKRVVEYVEGVQYTAAELSRMEDCLRGLLRFLTVWLQRGQCVDLVQGMLTNVLRSHGPLIARFGKALVPELQALAAQQNRVRYSVDHLVSYPSTLAGVFSGSLL